MENKDVTCLAYFEYNINGDTFRRLFQEAGGSKHMADHIWDKFADYEHSFLRTFGMADSGNRDILFKVATKWCKENDYPGKKEAKRDTELQEIIIGEITKPIKYAKQALEEYPDARYDSISKVMFKFPEMSQREAEKVMMQTKRTYVKA